MGLKSFVRAYLKRHYKGTWDYCPPAPAGGERPTVGILSLMQFVKALPDDVTTADQAVDWYVRKARWELNGKQSSLTVLIITVDREKLDTKALITHTVRYANVKLLDERNAPYLPANGGDLLPVTGKQWKRFAGNQLLMRRELYPRLFNAFMDPRRFAPKEGALVVLHGFPGYMEWVTMPDPTPYLADTTARTGRTLEVHLWNTYSELPITAERERRDPDLYNRIYTVENVRPCAEMPSGGLVRREWVDAKNDISEDECAAFFYDRYFPNCTFLIMGNDTDVFMYALMYARRRIVAGINTFRNNHILRLPFLKSRMSEEDLVDIIEHEANDPDYEPEPARSAGEGEESGRIAHEKSSRIAQHAAIRYEVRNVRRKKPKRARDEEGAAQDADDCDDGDLLEGDKEEGGGDDDDEDARIDNDEEDLKLPRYEYWDVNGLYCAIREDREMSEAGVQDHVAYMVLMMILGECDFLRGHLKGIGKDTVVWPLMLKTMRTFSHLVQVPTDAWGVRSPITVVVDETAARILFNFCSAQKHGGPARKKNKLKPNDPTLTPAMVRAHCAAGAQGRRMADRQQARAWARQAQYYMLLIANGPLGGAYAPSPYITCPDGLPLFPFVRNPQTGVPEMCDVVSPRGLPVDDVYRQHHFDALYEKGQPTLVVAAERRRRIVAQFGDGGGVAAK